MNPRADFEVLKIKDDAIYIVDICGKVSITNDAEAVVKHLTEKYGSKYRFYYCDTDGFWDELLHDGNGNFTKFHILTETEKNHVKDIIFGK
jgi:hypothetical protein